MRRWNSSMVRYAMRKSTYDYHGIGPKDYKIKRILD